MDSLHKILADLTEKDVEEWTAALARTAGVLDEVRKERFSQDKRYGINRILTHGEWSILITEEIGEVAKAVLERNDRHARAELIQVAALAVAWIESIDNHYADDDRPITNGRAE